MKKQTKIQLLDSYGKPTGEKNRELVNKATDVLHVVHIILRFGDRVYLSKIPKNKELPNLYAGKWSSTLATMLRVGETEQQAVLRCILKETNLQEIHTAEFIHSSFERFDGIKRMFSVFVYKVNQELKAEELTEADGMKEYTKKTLEKELKTKPNTFAASFRVIWERVGEVLFK